MAFSTLQGTTVTSSNFSLNSGSKIKAHDITHTFYYSTMNKCCVSFVLIPYTVTKIVVYLEITNTRVYQKVSGLNRSRNKQLQQ
jgi:hypothetical protein